MVHLFFVVAGPRMHFLQLIVGEHATFPGLVSDLKQFLSIGTESQQFLAGVLHPSPPSPLPPNVEVQQGEIRDLELGKKVPEVIDVTPAEGHEGYEIHIERNSQSLRDFR